MSLLVAWPSALAWMRLLEFASIIGPSYALYFNLISTAFPALFKVLLHYVQIIIENFHLESVPKIVHVAFRDRIDDVQHDVLDVLLDGFKFFMDFRDDCLTSSF